VPGRSVPHGLKIIRDSFNAGKRYFVRSDISGFFDHIPRLDVIARISKNVDDQRFIDILTEATTVVLGNEEKLGEDRGVFPTNEEGVAQGSPLSPLFGNILLHEFDLEFNRKGITCVRFIDDFVLLAETESKARKAFKSAESALKNLGLNCHNPFTGKTNPDKASCGHIDIGFVFLGYDIRPGLFQPSKQARLNLLKTIDGHLSFGRATIAEVKEANYSFEGRQRYSQTLVLIDKVVRGWGDAFAYSNGRNTLEDLDLNISKRLDGFRDWFAQQIKGQDWKTKRRLGGVGLVSDVRSKNLDEVPFVIDGGQRFVRSKLAVTVSTDGSIITVGRKKGKDQGPGGWAFTVHETGEEKSGSVESSTNNQMELRAVIEAIRFVSPDKPMIIRTDSQYVVEAVKGQTVMKNNADLWREYNDLVANRKLKIIWVKGHNGDPHNERANNLALKAARCARDDR
jgi:ribonuclease HI